MKEAVAMSPFAAKSRQEQQEQWIWWQCQQDATLPAEPVRATAETLPEPQVPRVQELQVQERQMTQPVQPAPRPVIRHQQYDAVVRRMQNAKRQVGAFTACTSASPTSL